jgi:hypothetical protein
MDFLKHVPMAQNDNIWSEDMRVQPRLGEFREITSAGKVMASGF